MCECQAGFREVPELGYVDDTAPALVLNGPAHMSMKQCDKYVERGVQVLDANSENTGRCDIKKKEKTKKTQDGTTVGFVALWYSISMVQYQYVILLILILIRRNEGVSNDYVMIMSIELYSYCTL